MPNTYSGDPSNNPVSIETPADGDPPTEAIFAPPHEGTFDKVCHVLDGDTTFTGAKLFQESVETAGGLIAGQVSDEEPAIDFSTVPSVSSRSLLLQIATNGRTVRVYARATLVGYALQGLDITKNALWNGTQWEADNTSAPAELIELFAGDPNVIYDGDDTPFRLRRKGTTAAAWNGDAWDTLMCGLMASNPAPTANPYPKNTVSSKSIIKAGGRLTTDGAGNLTLVDGFGMANTPTIGGAAITVTLRNAMANSNYIVMVTQTDLSGIPYVPLVLSTTQFTIGFRDYAGVAVDPAADSVGVNFTVLGEQS